MHKITWEITSIKRKNTLPVISNTFLYQSLQLTFVTESSSNPSIIFSTNLWEGMMKKDGMSSTSTSSPFMKMLEQEFNWGIS